MLISMLMSMAFEESYLGSRKWFWIRFRINRTLVSQILVSILLSLIESKRHLSPTLQAFSALYCPAWNRIALLILYFVSYWYLLKSFQPTSAISSCKYVRHATDFICTKRNYGKYGTHDQQKLNEICPYYCSVENEDANEIKIESQLCHSNISLIAVWFTSGRQQWCRIRTRRIL